jgi:hypothetical protein
MIRWSVVSLNRKLSIFLYSITDKQVQQGMSLIFGCNGRKIIAEDGLNVGILFMTPQLPINRNDA